MPTSTGKVGEEGLIEIIGVLADEWDQYAADAMFDGGMFASVAEEHAYQRCAKELRALVSGYLAGKE